MNARALRLVAPLALVGLSACSSMHAATNEANGDASASPTASATATAEASASPIADQKIADKKKEKKVTVTSVDIAEEALERDAVDPSRANDKPPTTKSTPEAPRTTTAANGPAEAKPQKVGAAQSTSGAGQMSRENIEATLGGSDFGACVDSSGTFSARLVVAPNGSVTEARVTKSEPDDPRVRDCLTEALRRLSFPASNAPVPLSFSLAIEPS